MTTKDQEPGTTEDEDFGSAFQDSLKAGPDDPFEPAAEEEEASGEQGKSASDEPAEPTPEQATEPDGGVPEDKGTPTGDEPAPAQQPTAEPPEPAQPAAAQPPEPAAAPAAAPPPEPAQPSAGSEPPAEPEQPKDWTEYLTDEEKKTLDTYNEEWGEVSEAERIRTQAMVRQAEERILKEVNQALTPVAQKVQQSEVQAHFDAIRTAHPEFDTLRQGPLQEWVKNMPNTVVRKAAEGVLKQGTTEEVIELVGMYKEQNGGGNDPNSTGQSTGAAPDVPASSQAPATASEKQAGGNSKGSGNKPPKPPVDPDAVSATAAVTEGSRGADPRGDDPDDFQAGFRETASG